MLLPDLRDDVICSSTPGNKGEVCYLFFMLVLAQRWWVKVPATWAECHENFQRSLVACIARSATTCSRSRTWWGVRAFVLSWVLSLSLSAGLLRDNYRLWLEALVQYLVAERARNVVNIYSYLRQALLRCQTWGSCQLQTMYLYFSSSRSPLQHRTWRSWLCFTLWFVQL